MAMNRRNLLLTGAAALSSRAAGAADMITLSPRPMDLEMPVEGFLAEITPTEQFFVRCHAYTPQVKAADWKLELDGLVDHPMSFTLADLRRMPRFELVSVLECAGNGRSFYEPRLPGAQWRFGSVGNARWSGVRLRDLLQKAGVKPGAVALLLDGADVPIGKMPDFQRTLPMEKGLHPDTMLALEMNGKPLTPEHGFPLRVVAPGWAGDSWVKWLQRITLLDHEFEGFWMKTAYRHPNHPVAAGATVDPKDMIPVTDLNIKSVIAHPGAWVKPGVVSVQGVAWSNASPVTSVEVSADSGKTWAAAKLLGSGTKYGFRRWSYSWKAMEGTQTLISRATNAAGQAQPMQQEWNPSGYLWNVAQPQNVLVSKSAPPAAVAPAAAEIPVPEGYQAACLGCHDDHMMRQQRLTRAQWDREVTKMTGWGAEVKPEHREGILSYLLKFTLP
jgi:sulfite oxidase